MMRPFLIASALLALAACQKPSQPVSNQTTAAAPGEPTKGVDRTHRGSSAPATTFKDPDGKATTLAAFAGKPTLVNLWASWCAPCVKELPTLDKLAKSKAGALNVVAISQDNGPHASVVAFLDEHQVTTLKPYQDADMNLSGALNAEVLPTSVLLDASGKEVWRYVGDQDWTSAAAAKLLAEGGVR